MNVTKKLVRSTLALSIILSLGTGLSEAKPITIEAQGSFTVGGAYKERPGKFTQANFVAEDGQRAYGDFAYVSYQKPVKAKKLPLIFQHGGKFRRNVSGDCRSWELTKTAPA